MKKQGFRGVSEGLAGEDIFVPGLSGVPLEIFGEKNDGSGKSLIPPLGGRGFVDCYPKEGLDML
jgi:hypothetical protein